MTTRALTAAEVLALPAMPTAQDAFAAIGISSDLGYQLIRDEEFPVEVIKLGARALRVRRSELLNFLGLAGQENDGTPGVEPGAPVEQSAPTAK